MIQIQKNQENTDYDKDEDDISITNIFNLPYPTIDKNAKWKLRDIFIEYQEYLTIWKILLVWYSVNVFCYYNK